MANLYKLGTNKQGLIVYNGESSADYGMVISEAPTFEKPQRKQTAFTVPGRNGAVIFQEDAWEDVTRSYKVWLSKSGRENLADVVTSFSAWLNSQKGYLRLEDNFEPDVFRLAYYSGGNDISNELMQYGETTLTFTCRPERFLKSAEAPVSVSNGDKLYNPCRFASKPLLHVEGSGAVTIAIGGNTISITGLVDYINIDCETMNAYRLTTENKNSMISGSFPQILAGNNTVGVTGTVTKLEITPRYYTI